MPLEGLEHALCGWLAHAYDMSDDIGAIGRHADAVLVLRKAGQEVPILIDPPVPPLHAVVRLIIVDAAFQHGAILAPIQQRKEVSDPVSCCVICVPVHPRCQVEADIPEYGQQEVQPLGQGDLPLVETRAGQHRERPAALIALVPGDAGSRASRPLDPQAPGNTCSNPP